MNLKYDPFPFIFENGDEMTTLACLEFFDLEGTTWVKERLGTLTQNQRADGAFPSAFEVEKWGMRETVRSAILLSRLNRKNGGSGVQDAVNFILDYQSPEGGWAENASLDLPQRLWS